MDGALCVDETEVHHGDVRTVRKPALRTRSDRGLDLALAGESGIVLGALVKRQSALRLSVSALARTDTVQASATLAAANVSFRLFMRTVYHITPFGVKGKSDGAPLEREVD